jgi:hypothetical protein
MKVYQPSSPLKMPSVAAICIGIDAKEINETLRSLSVVGHHLKEMIVIDSTNGNEVEIPERLASIKKHIRQYPAIGISNAFNTGVQEAMSEYLVFYNGGDTCVKEGFLKSMEIIITNQKISVVAGDVILQNGDKEKLWRPRVKNGKPFQIHHIGTLYRKELHKENGLYDPMMKCAMDYSFLRRAINSIKDDQIVLSNTACGKFKMGGVSSVMNERKHNEVLAADLLTDRGHLVSLLAYYKSVLGSKLRKCIWITRRYKRLEGSRMRQRDKVEHSDMA